MVHSLDTEFQVSDLQIDPANSLLMAAARDTKALTECVALHHLKLTPGIFRLKGRLGLPVGVTGRLAKNTGSIKALQVQKDCKAAAAGLSWHPLIMQMQLACSGCSQSLTCIRHLLHLQLCQTPNLLNVYQLFAFDSGPVCAQPPGCAVWLLCGIT